MNDKTITYSLDISVRHDSNENLHTAQLLHLAREHAGDDVTHEVGQKYARLNFTCDCCIAAFVTDLADYDSGKDKVYTVTIYDGIQELNLESASSVNFIHVMSNPEAEYFSIDFDDIDELVDFVDAYTAFTEELMEENSIDDLI
jgi:hypothetical protein